MGQINIYILVDLSLMKSEDGIITNPSECIYMYDDQYYSYYNPKTKRSELGSYVSPGDLITWTVLPMDPDNEVYPCFSRIIDTTENDALFNNSKNILPLVFRREKRACATISDNLKAVAEKEHYRYKVYIKKSTGDEEYSWDPFVEVRDEG